MGRPTTSIKTTEQARDRLRVLAEEAGTTIADLVEELALLRPTAARRGLIIAPALLILIAERETRGPERTRPLAPS
ncbi:hypothetical protein [Streptomyces sp. NPDC055099]